MGTDVNNIYKLFAEPSFLQGVGTLVDVSGALIEYNYSKTPDEADAKSIASDWLFVGQDLTKAINLYREEYNEQPEAAG